MQLVNFFNQFMNDEVNLNQTRLNILSNKRTTIQNFIKSSSTFKDRYIDMFSQVHINIELLLNLQSLIRNLTQIFY